MRAERTTVPILGADGWQERESPWQSGGLAVTSTTLVPVDGDGPEATAWRITHVASGRALPGTWWSPESAQATAELLLPMADWTLSMERLRESLRTDAGLAGAVAALRALQDMGVLP